MKQQYESEILSKLMERDGFNIPSSVPPYEAEIKAYLINQVKQAYPKLTDYEAEWLLYNYTKHLPADFPIKSVSNVTMASFENVVPYAYQSAILKGCTGYRDIDTGEILETFEEGRNLELVSVKMPVLTTSNEDGTKTNILTVNEPIELRGIGDIKDELNLLTGELTQRITEIVLSGSEEWENQRDPKWNNDTHISFRVKITDMKTNKWDNGKTNCISDKFETKVLSDSSYIMAEEFIGTDGAPLELMNFNIKLLRNRLNGNETVDGFKQWLSKNPLTIQYELATESIKTVDLTTVNEKGESTYFMPIEGTMNVISSGETITPTFDMSVPVEATTQNLASFIDMEME